MIGFKNGHSQLGLHMNSQDLHTISLKTSDLGCFEPRHCLCAHVCMRLTSLYNLGLFLQINVYPRESFSITKWLQNGQCQIAGQRVVPSHQRPEEALSAYMDLGYLFFNMKHLPHPDRVCFADIVLDKSIGNWPWGTRGCLFLYLSMLMTNDNTGEKRNASTLTDEHADAIQSSLQRYSALQDEKDPNVGFSQVVKLYAGYR